MSSINPLPITGSTTASKPSVGTTGSTAPTSATEIGVIDNSGKLQGASATNPLRIDPTGTTVQPVSGTVTSNQGSANATPWNENVAQWGGTAVSAPTATASLLGNETAPVARVTQRKSGQILTTTPLAANATYDSSAVLGVWFDSNSEGTTFAQAVSYSGAIASASNGFKIIQTNDTTNVNVFNTVIQTSVSISGLPIILSAQITMRYWKIVYINGATLQTTFELTVTSGNMPQSLQVSGSGSFSSVGVTPTNAVPVGLLAGGLTDGLGFGGGIGAILQANGTLAIQGVLNCSVTSSTGNVVMNRMPNIFKTVSVSATASGNTAMWTPAAGKKFRLMRFQITGANIAANAATVITVSFQDGTTGMPIAFDFLMPAVANVQSGTQRVSGWIDLGNGIISSTANNVLNVNVSATVTGATGTFRVNCEGTEE